MFAKIDKAADKYAWRREVVFIVLSGIFLGSLAILNILGISRALDLSFTITGVKVPFMLFIGVLPYPITFLCTDFISEMYGRRRANLVVWVGFILNLWVLFILWIGGALPPEANLNPETGLPPFDQPDWVFFRLRQLTFAGTIGSMVAYLTAQFIDVQIFHFLKRITKGKHLWLRNNGSTLTSQLVDSVAVILITYYTGQMVIGEGASVFDTLFIYMASTYIFKLVSALIDTVPFYYGVKFLSKYLDIDPNEDLLERMMEDSK